MIARRLAAGLASLFVAASALHAAEYPSKPITIVVPFPPGGTGDLSARLLSSTMASMLNQPMVVMNKPGAGGAIGMSSVAASAPDGYTLLLTNSAYSIVPAADRAAGRQPQIETTQLVPIALISANTPVLMVRREAPWNTARQFLDDAGRRPGSISYASTGMNSWLHLTTELLAREARVTLKHTPYMGVGPALNDLLAGQVDAMLVVTPSLRSEHVRTGKLVPLLVMGDKRLSALPNVPTTRELGYRGTDIYLWNGLFAPAGTPWPMIRTLTDAVRRVLADSAFRNRLEMVGLTPDFRAETEFREFLATDAARIATALGTTPPRFETAPSVAPIPPTLPSSGPSVMPLPKESATPSGPSVMPLPRDQSK